MILVYTYYSRLSLFTRAPQSPLVIIEWSIHLVGCLPYVWWRRSCTLGRNLVQLFGALTHGIAAKPATRLGVLAPGITSFPINIRHGSINIVHIAFHPFADVMT